MVWRHLLTLALVVVGSFAAPQRYLHTKIDADANWRVVGGEAAEDGAFPYQISLRYTGNSHTCGGSIIADRWILCAAHCVVNSSPSSLIVVVGTNKLNQGGTTYMIEKIFAHPNYSSSALQNDVSLIQLKEPIEFTDKVQPTSLEREDVGGDIECRLSGWGTTSYPGNIPNDLQHVGLSTITNDECQIAHSRTIVESQICTLTKVGEGACHGDSGGPLVRYNDEEKPVQIGIVSWGTPCARGKPDVFTRVSSFIDWINGICDNCIA